MEYITDFLDPGRVPDVTGDDLDVEKATATTDVKSDDPDTVIVNVDVKQGKDKSMKDVKLPSPLADLEVPDDNAKSNENSSDEQSDDVDNSIDDASTSDDANEISDDANEISDDANETADTPSNDSSDDTSTEKEEESVDQEDSTNPEDDASDETNPEDASTNDSAENQVAGGTGEVENPESDLSVDVPQEEPPLLALTGQWQYHNTKTYNLPNGIKVVYAQVPGELCQCSFQFAVGSFYEDDSNRGISHLLEHLMFNGCPGMSSMEFSAALDKLGMYLNAYTNTSYTCYYFNGLKSGFISAFERYFRLLSSFTLLEDVLEKEKGVVINEIGVYADRPASVLYDTINAQAYRQHPIMHPIIGYENIIRDLTVDQVQGWYDKYYGAENLTVYLVGDFSDEDLVFVADKLQGIKSVEKSSFPVITDAMALPFVKNVIAYKEGITQTLVRSYLPFINEGFNFVQSSILANILGHSMSSFLWKEFREDRSIAYSVGSSVDCMDPRHMILFCHAGLDDANNADLSKDLFVAAFTHGKSITEDEFNKGLAMFQSEFFQEDVTVQDIVSWLIDLDYFKIDYDEFIDSVKSVTFDSYLTFAENIDIDSIVTGTLFPMQS